MGGEDAEEYGGLTPRFSADRAVREYTEQHYLPAAATFHERAADKGAVGKNIVNRGHALQRNGPRSALAT